MHAVAADNRIDGMTLYERIKDVLGLVPMVPRQRVEPPAETAEVDAMFESAVKRQCEASDELASALSGADRSARVSSIVTKTLVKRQLGGQAILRSADEAMRILEGRLHAPPR